jgi:hypothetical protein
MLAWSQALVVSTSLSTGVRHTATTLPQGYGLYDNACLHPPRCKPSLFKSNEILRLPRRVPRHPPHGRTLCRGDKLSVILSRGERYLLWPEKEVEEEEEVE